MKTSANNNWIRLQKYWTLGIILLLNAPVFSQSQKIGYWNRELEKIALYPENPDWINLRPAVVKNGARFFEEHKIAMGLGIEDEMRLSKKETDRIGITHYRYQQYYKGVKMEGCEMIVHEKEGYVTSLNGKMVHAMNKNNKPLLSESGALQLALAQVPAEKYEWEDPTEEQLLREKTGISDTSYYRSGTLVWQKRGNSLPFVPDEFRLCYHFEIYTKVPFNAVSVFVDATSGEIVNSIPLIADCSPVAVSTNWYGTKTINSTFSSPNYLLKDNCLSSVITVYNDNNGTVLGPVYTKPNNTSWSSSSDLISASTSLWACKRIIEFYASDFGRIGYDSIGGDITIRQNALINGSTYNAAFSGGTMFVGNGSGTSNTDDFNTLDIIGHEITHGVTGTTAGLDYQGESGALNESFSDCLGTKAEYWDATTPFDWLIGEDRGIAIRSLSDPASHNQPDTYSGTNWFNTIGCIPAGSLNDNCGVHTNSGVQNYCFYLLSVGGAGTNDAGTSFSVTGIGIDKASQIAYRALRHYLTSSSQYIDARSAWLQAAIDLFGSCSNEAIQTGNAWYAVNVGSSSYLYEYNVCGTFTNPYFVAINQLDIANGCNTTLNPSPLPAVFKASQAVVFHPGFKALNGSYMEAYIDPCSITSYKEMDSGIPENEPPVSELVEDNALKNIKIEAMPNPFAFQTLISYNLPEDGAVNLILYNMQMQPVKTIYSGDQQVKGQHQFELNVDELHLPAGIYLFRLRSGITNGIIKLLIQ